MFIIYVERKVRRFPVSWIPSPPLFSLAFQYGVPLKVLINKFSRCRYEPSGITNNPEVRFAKSITDYIFRWMALKFLPAGDSSAAELAEGVELPKSHVAGLQAAAPAVEAPRAHSHAKVAEAHTSESEKRDKGVFQSQSDAPPCPECGTIMVRSAACYKCLNCGTSTATLETISCKF